MAQFTAEVGGRVGLLRRLWDDDCGALLATEWVVMVTLLVLGLIPALIAVRQGVLSEMTDFSHAATSLDQSYGFTGQFVGCDANAADPRRATTDADLADKMTPTGALAVRTGADPAIDGHGVAGDHLYRGGVQAFTAGSAFVEPRNFDGAAKAIDAHSTPARAHAPGARACD
jgi:hypothetical protein